ncbi:MAG: hypothetical protein V4722_12565 [Bacteroidota bacterium]
MKKIICVSLLCCFFNSLVAQQQGAIIKSYAYSQEFMPGVQRVDEEVKPITNYFMYVEILKKTKIDVKYIWIGKACSIPTTISVEKLPVVIINNGSRTIKEVASEELVPKTKNAVLQVMPTEPIEDTKLTTGKKLAAKNAFVIAYVYRGKWYYYTGKKIKQLEKQFGM